MKPPEKPPEAPATPLVPIKPSLVGQPVNNDVELYRELAALPMPDDPLDRVIYAQEALTISLRQTMRDPNMTGQQRRKQIMELARAIERMVPKSRLRAAELLVMRSAEREDRSTGGELEDAPKKH